MYRAISYSTITIIFMQKLKLQPVLVLSQGTSLKKPQHHTRKNTVSQSPETDHSHAEHLSGVLLHKLGPKMLFSRGWQSRDRISPSAKMK